MAPDVSAASGSVPLIAQQGPHDACKNPAPHYSDVGCWKPSCVECGKPAEVEDEGRGYCWAHRPARYNLLGWPDDRTKA